MEKPTESNLDELIKEERRRAAKRIAKLKREAAAEQRKIDERVILLLQDQEEELYERLTGEAGEQLRAEKELRSARARKTGAPRVSQSPASSVDDTHAGGDDGSGSGVAPAWSW